LGGSESFHNRGTFYSPVPLDRLAARKVRTEGASGVADLVGGGGLAADPRAAARFAAVRTAPRIALGSNHRRLAPVQDQEPAPRSCRQSGTGLGGVILDRDLETRDPPRSRCLRQGAICSVSEFLHPDEASVPVVVPHRPRGRVHREHADNLVPAHYVKGVVAGEGLRVVGMLTGTVAAQPQVSDTARLVLPKRRGALAKCRCMPYAVFHIIAGPHSV
jgi:hypothetical protein